MARPALTLTFLAIMTGTLGCGPELDDELEAELREAPDAAWVETPAAIAAAEPPAPQPMSDEQDGEVCTDPELPDELRYSGGVVEVCAGDVKCACTSPQGGLKIMEIVTPQNQCPIIQGWICEPFMIESGQECAAADYMARAAPQCLLLECVEGAAGTDVHWSPPGCCAVEHHRTCCCGDLYEGPLDIDAISVIG